MKSNAKIPVVLLLAAVASIANAQTTFTYNTLDQVNNYGGHVQTATFAVNQHFEPSFSAFNSGVADDATGAAGFINRVAVGLDFSIAGTLGVLPTAITGWDIYVSSSQATLAGGGGLVATVGNNIGTNVFVSVSPIASGLGRVFEITGLNIAVGAGNFWYAVVPIMDFTPNGQTFIISNTTSLLPGGPNNSTGFNPGGGFGVGTQVAVNTNAALAVNIVPIPEPASIFACCAIGFALIARRRRSK